MAVMALFGFSSAAYGPILAEMTLLTVGLDDFSAGYSVLLVSQAIGTLTGAPIAGKSLS